MSAKNSRVEDSLTKIANDAVELLGFEKDHIRWLSALMRAIQIDLQHNCGRCAKDLANLGQYLGDDCLAYLESSSEKLQNSLDSVEVTQ
ncbi:hypothetical protein KC131_03500 [Pseudomonas sp. JQ170]|uniref:hypothetical protein n=1 Tax=Pseudomonas TaxID=286 RepID=UPI000FB59B29|nr:MULTISPECIES: hypothetical protein [Pseudomonas]MDN7139699.1 hypothetical protein [Pseudomonas sp. JQ170]WRO76993.1 hypothetical protein U9R80_04745 [Pseudomonas sp. 170C]